jgi:hypothetical protein
MITDPGLKKIVADLTESERIVMAHKLAEYVRQICNIEFGPNLLPKAPAEKSWKPPKKRNEL